MAFQRLSDAADASNPSSSEGSAGSLSGHKRRQADLEPSSRSTSVPIHLRFTDSDSESEDDGDGVSRRAQIAKRRGVVPRAAAAMALEACSIQDVVPIQPSRAGAAPGRGGGGEAAAAAGRRNSSSVWMGIEVQAATQPAEEDADVAPAVQQPRLPSLVVANIHVLFNPRRGDMKMGQVRVVTGISFVLHPRSYMLASGCTDEECWLAWTWCLTSLQFACRTAFK